MNQRQTVRYDILCLLLLTATLLVACGGQNAGEQTISTGETRVSSAPALVTAAASTPKMTARLPGDESPTAEPVRALTVTASEPAVASETPATTELLATPSEPSATTTTTPTSAPSATPSPEPTEPEGALVALRLESEVAVLLDDFPAEMRERVAQELLTAGDAFWQARAERQVRLATLRLHFRNLDTAEKGQLPLPPVELWQITVDAGGPQRITVQGHDLVSIPYTFNSTLLADAPSVRRAEPALGVEGGRWQEPFVFPADPDMLLQRTGNACVNEGGFPANSFDSENVWRFYDDTCTADSGGVTGCHRLRLPNLDCRQAIASTIGEVETAVQFERLPWDAGLAQEVTVGPLTTLDAPDLLVVADDLDDHRLVYRYIPNGDCGLLEGAVGGAGWRRLLTFGATVHNVGGAPLHIGEVRGDLLHNLFQYNACHNHFHYRNYGDFSLGTLTDDATSSIDELFNVDGAVNASKQAFCVQSTSRFSNNVLSPLVHGYSCRFQGVQTGWVDEYIAGLDTQWIDVTNVELPEGGETLQLGFRSNGDQFLCEGKPVLDEDGNPIWEPTGFTTESGASVDRPLCDFSPDWDANNVAIRDVFVPQTGSFVTLPCRNDEVGPLRNCGFVAQEPADASCVVEEPVELEFSVAQAGAPQVIRVCEYSAALDTGVACTYEDALANVVVSSEPTALSFTCPLVRDAEEFTGRYTLYSAPAWPADGHQTVVLTAE